jgi:5-methylcytosine-specific restriction endonuclease McrA
MAGWEMKSGLLNTKPMNETEIWSLINFFFSSQSKNTTTYKFALLKAILDEAFNLSPSNNQISFNTIFEKFSEIYWNLSVNQQIKQSTGRAAAIEIVLNNFAIKNPATRALTFGKLSLSDRISLIKKVTTKGKPYVFGAVYTDFNGQLFGFNLKSGLINIHPKVIPFLKNFKININKLNNYEWIRWMERNSKIKSAKEYVYALENSIERMSLKAQMNSFKKEKSLPFKCFYCPKTPTTLDHIIPWSFIGNNKTWNLVYCCTSCNSTKNARICNQQLFNLILKRNKNLQKIKYDFNDEFKTYSEIDYLDLYNYAKKNGLRIW